MPLFTTLDVQRVCQEIAQAKSNVVLAAPGISCSIAEALIAASERLSEGNLQVVLDVSPSVARLGFGEHDAVELLRGAGRNVRHHPGLRIGVLICDRHGWCFTSTPRLVEADPTAHGGAFNAIALTEAQVLALRGELPQVYSEYGGTTGKLTDPSPLVGSKALDDATLERVRTALEIAPPQQFDLARQTQVYAALIEFVELSFEGFNIQSRRVQLPKTLPMIASKDKALKNRLTASLKLLDKVEKPLALREITDSLADLRKAYLVPVGPAGSVMLKSKRHDFESELLKIEKSLNECKKSLVQDLQSALDNVVSSITTELARAVLTDPPLRFRGLYAATETAATEYVREELANSFPSAEALVASMKIHKFYKDVTYETLKNKEFVEKVMREIPKSVLDGSLLTERVAPAAGAAS